LSFASSGFKQAKYSPMTASPRPQPEPRSAYRVFRRIDTRLADNDVYGHVNNVVYYSWFDTAVNGWLIEQGALDMQAGAVIGLVVQTQCNYFSPLAFPEPVAIGLRVAHVGTSSVRYALGVFAFDQQQASAASGHLIHVYVDRMTRQPQPLPASLRALLETLK
jgi:acyl-CoA thioester hydrolase